MEFEFFMRDRRQSWNRQLLNVYWAIIATFPPFAFFVWINQEYLHYEVIKERISMPSLILLTSMVVLEIMYRISIKYFEYFIISVGCLLSFIYIYANYEIKGIILAHFLPILVSIFYFERYKIIFSFVLTLCSFFILFPTRLAPLAQFTINDLIFITPIIGFTAFFALKIIDHGDELLHFLKRTTDSHRELMIQNVIMDKLSKTDALTDLYNHITFHEYLEKIIEHSEAGQLTIHLAIIDIDNFKKINDTYGHRVGDSVLKRVSAIIKERVGLHDFAARYGGEEFSIIFAENSIEEVFELLEKIRWQISQTHFEELNNKTLTVSIGLMAYQEETSKEQLFVAADHALYEAKRTGKNKTVIYSQQSKHIVG
ncbi:putative diguanylate cyclase YcdT [compost metagenome]